jgi:hypothetical protein
LELGRHPVDVGEPPHRIDAFQRAAHHRRQEPRLGARGQRQLVVVHCFLAQPDATRRRLDPRHLRAQPQVDPVLAVERLRPQEQPLHRHLTQQVFLRQRRALVGRHRLFADQRHRPLVPQRAQLRHQRRPRLPGANHHDSRHCAAFPSGPEVGATL